MAMIRRLVLEGFKSIKGMDLELRSLNVFIGANGAGKSNLVSFLKMLNEMIEGRLQQYIGKSGHAQSLLYFGPKITAEIRARVDFSSKPDGSPDSGCDAYAMRLTHAAGDTLVFAEETLVREDFLATNAAGLGSGHQESHLAMEADRGNEMAADFRNLLSRCRVFHFHDTSQTAPARAYCYVGNDRWLMADAGNVAAMLYRFKRENDNPAYRRILGTVRQIAPFIAEFELEPTGTAGKDIILNWKDRHTGQVLGAHQLSDGTLRFISLATLLLQPQNMLPDVIVIDEPELGQHPAGLNILAGMLRSVSHHCQVVVATQSAALVDGFAPEDVVVASRAKGASSFERLTEEGLKDWLEDYTLGQLWEKNVVGGGPFG